MQYRDLAHWLLDEMQPQEIYQPAAVICLIYNGGRATLEQIHEWLELRRRERAAEPKERDLSTTREMPCKVLIERMILRADSEDNYQLLDFETFTPQQLTAIVSLCESRIADWNRKHFKG